MRFSTILMIAGLTISSASEAMELKPWYESHPKSVKTLKQAMAEEGRFLSYRYTDEDLVNLPRDRMSGPGHAPDPRVCRVLKSVGLACDYNTRLVLTEFLTVNGKGLFPSAGGTNPHYGSAEYAYYFKHHPQTIDNSFIGSDLQNALLAVAVRINAKLFHKGDLAAADVRAKWR